MDRSWTVNGPLKSGKIDFRNCCDHIIKNSKIFGSFSYFYIKCKIYLANICVYGKNVVTLQR